MFAMVAVGLLVGAASLQAQTASGQAYWNKGSSLSEAGWYSNANVGLAQWIYPISPYREQFKIPTLPTNQQYLPAAGTSTFGPVVDVYCVNFEHGAESGVYNVYFTNLAQDPGAVGTYTRSYGTQAFTLKQYLEDAWLIQQGMSNPANERAIQGAIWNISSPGSPLYYSNVGKNGPWISVASWVTAAEANYASVNPNDWTVVTPYDAIGQDKRGGQEFLVHVTPEPATMLLLGTGLMVMLVGAGALRRHTA